MKARCPLCGGLHGPLVRDLLLHLRDAHGRETEWFNLGPDTFTLKLAGWLPGTLEFVEDDPRQNPIGNPPGQGRTPGVSPRKV